MHYEMPWFGYHGMWWPIVSWSSLIFGIFLVIYLVAQSEKIYKKDLTAIEILNRRLAKGDINQNEYESIKQTIESNKNEPTKNKESKQGAT